jgi:hypothetical protein
VAAIAEQSHLLVDDIVLAAGLLAAVPVVYNENAQRTAGHLATSPDRC